LSDGTVTLRASAERDIPEILIGYQDDREMHRALGEPRPPSGAALGRRAEAAEDARRSGRSLTLTILAPASDRCRGEVRVSNVDWKDRTAELRVWVAPEVRGHGLGGHAQALTRRWLGERCRLDARCPVSAVSEPES
jgi:RimJ/RimL family protein N-acetyltransferase